MKYIGNFNAEAKPSGNNNAGANGDANQEQRTTKKMIRHRSTLRASQILAQMSDGVKVVSGSQSLGEAQLWGVGRYQLRRIFFPFVDVLFEAEKIDDRQINYKPLFFGT